MASGAYALQQQRPSTEARIKALVNNDLKEICKAYNVAVSGNKSLLQTRCIEILNAIIDRGDRQEFEDFNFRVSNHGQARRAPMPQPSATSVPRPPHGRSNPATSHSHHNGARPVGIPSRLPLSTHIFKPSPFYEVQETVLAPGFLSGGPAQPQTRNTVQATLRLREDAVRKLAQDSTLRLLLYCGVDLNLSSTSSPIDITFPTSIEVRINGDEVRSNYKGLKNKVGSTKPADITDKVRIRAGYENRLSITYALTPNRHVFAVQLARHIDAAKLTERMRLGKFIPKQTVLDEMNKANSDPDIVSGKIRMSLKDPVSTLRISVPVRSDRCAHNQCFDGYSFMLLQEQAPQWTCVICSRAVTFESLRVDMYFDEILKNTQQSIEKVDIEPDGEWRVIKEEDEGGVNGQSKPAARAPYDDDSDDDIQITEIKAETPTEPANGALALPLPPLLSQDKQINTPPASSREASMSQTSHGRPQSAKRTTNEVISLLSSDEEDEPPRPAKRQATSMPHRNPTVSYNTSHPVPEHSRQPPYDASLQHHADKSRPSYSTGHHTSGGPANYRPSNGAADSSWGNHQASRYSNRPESPFEFNNRSTGQFAGFRNRHMSSTPAIQPFRLDTHPPLPPIQYGSNDPYQARPPSASSYGHHQQQRESTTPSSPLRLPSIQNQPQHDPSSGSLPDYWGRLPGAGHLSYHSRNSSDQ